MQTSPMLRDDVARVPRFVQPQRCLTEALHKENVRLGSFDSSKEKGMAV